jgi:chromosome segregation ATPase
MTLSVDNLNALRQQLKMENASLEGQKMALINDINVQKDRRRAITKEIENLVEEKKKVASEFNAVKERTEKELSQIAEKMAEVNAEQKKNIAEIGKMREEVTKMKAEVEKEKKENEKKIEVTKSQLKECLTSILKSLAIVSIDIKNSMETLLVIIKGL